MAELKTWAENGPVEEPDATEFDVGFACDKAPRNLFNWLFRQVARDNAFSRSLGFYRSAIAMQNDPPTTPSAGDSYVVGDEPTGVWDGKANKIAEYSGESWNYIDPRPWMLVGLSNKSDIRWDHAGGAWQTVAVHTFATEQQHLDGTSTGLVANPSGVAAMISAAIGGLPPDQVLGLSDEPETVTGTNTTKATHAAGVKAAILHHLGPGNSVRAFEHASDNNAPTAQEWASPADGSKALVSDASQDIMQIWQRRSNAWVSLGTIGGSGDTGGRIAGFWQGLGRTGMPYYSSGMTWTSGNYGSSFFTLNQALSGTAMYVTHAVASGTVYGPVPSGTTSISVGNNSQDDIFVLIYEF